MQGNSYVLLKSFESLQCDHCIDKFRLADLAKSVKLAGVAGGRAALLLEGLLSLRRGPSEAAQGAGGGGTWLEKIEAPGICRQPLKPQPQKSNV